MRWQSGARWPERAENTNQAIAGSFRGISLAITTTAIVGRGTRSRPSTREALSANAAPVIHQDWLSEVRASVDSDLAAVFEAERARAMALSGDASLVEALEALTMRGGKRLRPAVLVAAHRAVDPAGSLEALLPACSALELLQSYLLAHDDWMDGDDTRRGGPSVHAALRAKVGDAHLGDSLAILAGDLGNAFALRQLMRTAAPRERVIAALEAFVDLSAEVVLGQQLDLQGSPDVSRMQRLKTGSYTVMGPLRLGALLGGATPGSAAMRALEAFAAPIGEAFQMADDLLGTFGDPRETGKSAGNDLRAGKRTALVRACEQRLSEADCVPLTKVLGVASASDVDIAAARELLVTSGAKRVVEESIAALTAEAITALSSDAISDLGRAQLTELAERLTRRRA